MASRRFLVSATTNDALADQDIRTIERPSFVNLYAGSVTVTDTIGLRLDKTIIMDDGLCNVRAAAVGLVDTGSDQLVFDTLVGQGTLRMPVTVTTSMQFLLSVEPFLG